MAIPTATHSITVRRRAEPSGWGEPEGDAVTLATGVRAVIGSPTGTEVGGTQGTTVLKLTCDEVVGLDHRCEVEDEGTGETYGVVWALRRPSLLGIHYEAGLEAVSGAAVAR